MTFVYTFSPVHSPSFNLIDLNLCDEFCVNGQTVFFIFKFINFFLSWRLKKGREKISEQHRQKMPDREKEELKKKKKL